MHISAQSKDMVWKILSVSWKIGICYVAVKEVKSFLFEAKQSLRSAITTYMGMLEKLSVIGRTI
jgi:hypothetical protein